MSSLVHTVVSDVISAQEHLQQHPPSLRATPLHLDSNNNTGGDFSVDDSKENSAEEDRTNSSIKASGSSEKYSLRPRSFQRRSETEDSKHAVATATRRSARKSGSSRTECPTRPKQKPPPLSKYRRKTANARERDRMREINAAFETLRRAVPHIPSSAHQNQHDTSGSEKLTKITTLRLAMKYIAALSQALQQPETLIPALLPPTSISSVGSISNSSSTSSSSSCYSSGSIQVSSDGELLKLKEQRLTPPDFTAHTMRQCLTPPKSTHLSSTDQCPHRDTPPLANKHQSLVFSYHFHKTMRTSTQNKLSIEPRSTTHFVAPVSLGDLSENLTSKDLSPECLITPSLDHHCNRASDNSQLCLPAPVLEPPDLSQHCLTPADFEEHTNEERAAFIVFDDDSLDSPDLDHLLIS